MAFVAVDISRRARDFFVRPPPLVRCTLFAACSCGHGRVSRARHGKVTGSATAAARLWRFTTRGRPRLWYIRVTRACVCLVQLHAAERFAFNYLSRKRPYVCSGAYTNTIYTECYTHHQRLLCVHTKIYIYITWNSTRAFDGGGGD